MGLKVSALVAARLANRGERTIRGWIATGKLPAAPAGARAPGEGVGPSRWEIDVEDLARMRGVVLNQALLAELEAREALATASPGVLERLTRLEDTVGDLRTEVERLQEQIDRLRTERPLGSGTAGETGETGKRESGR